MPSEESHASEEPSPGWNDQASSDREKGPIHHRGRLASPSPAELETALLVLRKWLGRSRPRWGVVLGSGLGGVASTLEQPRGIPMEEISGFPRPAVVGHGATVWLGKWRRESVLIFEGRPHLYEGRGVEEITRPVRAMRQIGVRSVILTNASGALDSGIPTGALVRACDLIDLFMRRIRGDRPMAADARAALDADLGGEIDTAARSLRIDLRRGTLAGVMGPAYETASEVRLLRRAGADLVSMSTIPEAFEARHVGMRVSVISLVTNPATGVGIRARLDHEGVVARAAAGVNDLGRLLRGTVGGRA